MCIYIYIYIYTHKTGGLADTIADLYFNPNVDRRNRASRACRHDRGLSFQR